MKQDMTAIWIDENYVIQIPEDINSSDHALGQTIICTFEPFNKEVDDERSGMEPPPPG